ncbi:MAG: hypothetical protein IMZ61_09790 [Planctomycetes bacterium]|nr:hypothetical protein [Planctomycetota bacterium]
MNLENALISPLALTNLVGSLILGGFLAIGFSRLTQKQNRFFRYFALSLGLYFLECVAFAWGMCTQIWSLVLSIEWGILFGMWLKGLAPQKQIIRQMLFVSLYGCLPAVSFAAILLIVWIISGNGLLNIEQARRFGIPDFVPWPLNTIMGFCVALAAGTIILKTFITTGIVALIVRDKESPSAGQLK